MEPHETTAPVLAVQPQERSRMKMMKRVLMGVGAVLLLALGTAVLAVPPRITWTPNPLVTESIAPGEQATYSVTLKNAGYLPIPATQQLRVVAEGAIAPYVTVTPPTFPAVFNRGQSVTFDVMVSVPADAPVGVSDGTLVLKRVIGKRVTEVWRAEVLPVSVEVVWPAVQWEPSLLPVEVGAGQSTAIEVTFTPSTNATNVSVEVVPELAPYVTVSPSSFPSVQEGINYAVTVTASAGSDAPLALYDGAIQLRQGNETLARPLPVSVEVVWPTFLGGEELGVVLQYPPGWVVERGAPDVDVVAFSLPGVNTKFQIFRMRDINPERQPLPEWFDAFSATTAIDPLVKEYTVLDGHDAIQTVVSEMFGVEAVHIYILDEKDVLDVVYSLYDPTLLQDYEAMVRSISLRQ